MPQPLLEPVLQLFLGETELWCAGMGLLSRETQCEQEQPPGSGMKEHTFRVCTEVSWLLEKMLCAPHQFKCQPRRGQSRASQLCCPLVQRKLLPAWGALGALCPWPSMDLGSWTSPRTLPLLLPEVLGVEKHPAACDLTAEHKLRANTAISAYPREESPGNRDVSVLGSLCPRALFM